MKLRPMLLSALMLVGCGGGVLEETDEVAHSMGDVMSSFDESSQGGSFAMRTPHLKRDELTKPGMLGRLSESLLPSAWAAACSTVTFDSCTAGKRTKTFGDCSIGLAKLSGSVNLTFSDPACSMLSAGSSITRAADFSLTGRRNATLAVTSPDGGQKVTRTATGFTYQVLGMRRVMTGPAGTTLFDISAKTLEDITVTGATRANRVMNGGKLQIQHNLAGYTTTISPENVTWNGTCNCAVSGKWTGTVTGKAGKSNSFTVEITGCGDATVTADGKSQSVQLDRCASL